MTGVVSLYKASILFMQIYFRLQLSKCANFPEFCKPQPEECGPRQPPDGTFYFDTRTGECALYGGTMCPPPGNVNTFPSPDGLELCTVHCMNNLTPLGPSRTERDCYDPMLFEDECNRVVGQRGLPPLPIVWYFHEPYGRCRQCDGFSGRKNFRNKFVTEHDCRRTCGHIQARWREETGCFLCDPQTTTCEESAGGNEDFCVCRTGYRRIDEQDSKGCVDIDECDPNYPLHNCDPQQVCRNDVGGYICLDAGGRPLPGMPPGGGGPVSPGPPFPTTSFSTPPGPPFPTPPGPRFPTPGWPPFPTPQGPPPYPPYYPPYNPGNPFPPFPPPTPYLLPFTPAPYPPPKPYKSFVFPAVLTPKLPKFYPFTPAPFYTPRPPVMPYWPPPIILTPRPYIPTPYPYPQKPPKYPMATPPPYIPPVMPTPPMPFKPSKYPGQPLTPPYIPPSMPYTVKPPKYPPPLYPMVTQSAPPYQFFSTGYGYWTQKPYKSLAGFVDRRECESRKIRCDRNANCYNSGSGFYCKCVDGFHGDGIVCNPIDRKTTPVEPYLCERFLGRPCNFDAECMFTWPNQYSCQCRYGFIGDGYFCQPIGGGGNVYPTPEVFIEDCQYLRCHPYAVCKHAPRSAYCECLPGFAGNGVECIQDRGACNELFDERYRDQCGHYNFQRWFFYDRYSQQCKMFWFGTCVRGILGRNVFSDEQTCAFMCTTLPTEGGWQPPKQTPQLPMYPKQPKFPNLPPQFPAPQMPRFPPPQTLPQLPRYPPPQLPKYPPPQPPPHYPPPQKPATPYPNPPPFYPTPTPFRPPVTPTPFPPKSPKYPLYPMPQPTPPPFYPPTKQPGPYITPGPPPIVPGSKACVQPCQPGFCGKIAVMYFFNTDIGQCQPFVYSGCGGNENKFSSLAFCQVTCQIGGQYDQDGVPNNQVCLMRLDQGFGRGNAYCEANTRYLYYFNYQTHKCEPFFYYGCGGNFNKFANENECMRTCTLVSPPRPPPFDPQNQDFPGPGSFPNPISPTPPSFGNSGGDCTGPPDMGPCRNLHHKWYFDARSDRCEQFTYGGCGGNENRYDTQSHCEMICRGNDPCTLPVAIGTCSERHERFYFEPSVRNCQPFVYTGCGGNANNFPTHQDCIARCARNKK